MTHNQQPEVALVGNTIVPIPEELQSDGIEWMRRQEALARFAVGKDVLDQWVRDDVVEAHKLNPGKNGTVIFCAGDIRRAIRNAPRYRPVKRK